MCTSIAKLRRLNIANFGKYMKKLKFLCNVENINSCNYFGKLFCVFVTVKYANYFLFSLYIYIYIYIYIYRERERERVIYIVTRASPNKFIIG